MTFKDTKIIHTKTGMISQENIERLNKISKERKIAVTRLIGYAIDNELSKPVPFEFDYSLPITEYVENAYALEANKIINYFKMIDRGLPLDTLVMLRTTIGIEDKDTFLHAFRECLYFNRLIKYKADRAEKFAPVADDYYHYKLKEPTKERKRKPKRTKEEREYDQYIKLQKTLKAKGLLDD